MVRILFRDYNSKFRYLPMGHRAASLFSPAESFRNQSSRRRPSYRREWRAESFRSVRERRRMEIWGRVTESAAVVPNIVPENYLSTMFKKGIIYKLRDFSRFYLNILMKKKGGQGGKRLRNLCITPWIINVVYEVQLTLMFESTANVSNIFLASVYSRVVLKFLQHLPSTVSPSTLQKHYCGLFCFVFMMVNYFPPKPKGSWWRHTVPPF